MVEFRLAQEKKAAAAGADGAKADAREAAGQLARPGG